MLENGGPFVLSSDMLNIIEGGDLNLYGSGRIQQHTSTQVSTSNAGKSITGPPAGEVKKTELKLVKHAPSYGMCWGKLEIFTILLPT